VRWTIPSIAACCALAASALAVAPNRPPAVAPAAADAACLACHPSASDVREGPMGTRMAERAFARRALGHAGDRFFDTACAGCHVTSCAGCHGDGAMPARAPGDEACLACHRGYFTGWDYHGRAPREDHERYQRGAVANGEHILKMLPDVHQQAGLGCADCHTVHGSGHGVAAVRTCRDCHPRISPDVPEHAITAHLERMECWACHSAWAAQEYGTFFIRPGTPEQEEVFSVLPGAGEWRRSAYLRRQDAPPLGLNARGKVSPIRPQFILFETDVARGVENRLRIAEWKAFFPHTVRRGTVTCSGCHDSPRRFVLEPDSVRIHRPDEDGLPLRSFWNREGQTVVNGAFLPADRHELMNRKTPQYVKEHLRQWQSIVDPAVRSSAR
jgi:hypothetical protein